ncbi:hypothetical protein E2C01_002672 [Portunus trituberculatus]|uniref:Uncharacterized protein n=1 Tax=Portunus trituberculatus TaxID=210409 RepID=A0A5B7CKD3_PORTR|nr:hypothetical protein [Portunus trituberculatus]
MKTLVVVVVVLVLVVVEKSGEKGLISCSYPRDTNSTSSSYCVPCEILQTLPPGRLKAAGPVRRPGVGVPRLCLLAAQRVLPA